MSKTIHTAVPLGFGKLVRRAAARFLRLCPDARVFPLGWRAEVADGKTGKRPHPVIKKGEGEGGWWDKSPRDLGTWPAEVWESATGYGVVLRADYLVVDIDGPNFPGGCRRCWSLMLAVLCAPRPLGMAAGGKYLSRVESLKLVPLVVASSNFPAGWAGSTVDR